MNKHTLFNSFLLAVCISVSGWVAHKTAETGERLAALQSGYEAVKESTGKAERASTDGLQRLERKLEDMVTRREFESRVLLVEAYQRTTDLRLREIDLELLKLRQELNPRPIQTPNPKP